MALIRRSTAKFSANIWPGFVDAMTALLLVLFFVLSIFMIVQFVLREMITGQDRELGDLQLQVLALSEALGFEQQSNFRFKNDIVSYQSEIADLQRNIVDYQSQIVDLRSEGVDLKSTITSFEEQVAHLLLEKTSLQSIIVDVRTEIDKASEMVRLAELEKQAMQALIDDLQADKSELGNIVATKNQQLTKALSESERQRLLRAATAAALNERLRKNKNELTALALILEEKHQESENTLMFLAAANSQLAKSEQANAGLTKDNSLLKKDYLQVLSEKEKQAILLAEVNRLLTKEQVVSAEGQRKLELLNQQILALNKQLGQLQDLFDAVEVKEIAAQVKIEALGKNLNIALARSAAEQKKRADLEKKERERLLAEKQNLEKFRSEFFGRIRDLLEGQDGIRMVGDRFVFSSEVLFATGSAILGKQGENELYKVAQILKDIAAKIPVEIDWILRVDGHTDKNPIAYGGQYQDNWQLSQARALSVVRYLINPLGIPSNRLAANGFGEFQPIDPADTPQAYSLNRRIELKFTEK